MQLGNSTVYGDLKVTGFISGSLNSNNITTSTITSTSFVKSGGTASQFLKADGSVDSTTYLSSYTDTLATVTGRGATTATALSITNATDSTTKDTGALIIDGGVGIEKNLNVGVNTTIGGTLSVTGNTIIGGNLTINGTTTTVNSTVTTIDDPVITLGGDTAPASDDSKDRGIEFRYHNGTSAKLGFFGFDDSTSKLTFIPDATNTSEVFSGTKGTIDANLEWVDLLNKPSIVNTWSGGSTGLTPNSATSGTVTLAGTLIAANGGTGITSYAIGDLLYASTSTVLSKLADVATGNVLISGGVGVAPSYGKVGLTTHISGTLAIGNGGTGATSTIQGGIVYGASTSAYGTTAAGTTGYVLKSNGTSAPTWQLLDMTYLPDSAFKKSVKVATTANITLSAPQTIDGVSVIAGDRVLVKNQTTVAENGIYIVNAAAWTRAASADSTTEIAGGIVNVDSGTVNGGFLFSNNFKTTDTLGTTVMPWYRVYSDFDSATANTANKLVLRDGSGNFTAGTITATALTTPTISASAALSVKSATTNALTLDSGTTGAIAIGTSAYAKTITIGNTTGATGVVVNSGTAGVIFNQVATGVFKIQTTAVPTTDAVQITNVGYPVTADGVNAISVSYIGGAAAVESSAMRIDMTPGTTSGGTWTSIRVSPTVAATTGVTQNGVKFDSVTAGLGTGNMLWAGTGWDNILNYNGASLINGSGQINASQLLTGTVPGDRGVTSGSAASSFVEYNGTTATAGQFDGGTTTPTGTTRLNYGGYFYPSYLNLTGSADTATAATHYYVETGTDGYVRPKTLANVKTEIVTSAAVISGLGYTPATKLTGTGTLAIASWAADATYVDYGHRYSYAITGALATDIIDINLNVASHVIAGAADICPTSESYAGGVYFYSKNIPSSDISFSYSILR